VRIIGELSEDQRQQLMSGVQLDDGAARFTRLEDAGGQGINHWYRAVISEGRNREVRRLFEAIGMQVSRLIRIRYGTIQLPRTLARGRYQELSSAWVEAWMHDLGVQDGAATKPAPGPAKKGGAAPRRGPNKPLRSGGPVNRQPDPMTSTVNYIAQDTKAGGAGLRGKRLAKPSRQPDPMISTVNYFAQDANAGARKPPRGGMGKPAARTGPGARRQPDPMTSTVNYIANDPNALGNRRPGGGAGGFKAKRGPGRQPDPMTSTVNYIARGHGTGAPRAHGPRRAKLRGE
jgi:23S rRNA pseudouridine2605 synthase